MTNKNAAEKANENRIRFFFLFKRHLHTAF